MVPFSENTETWAAAAAATGSVTVSEVTGTAEAEFGVLSGAGGASEDPLFTPDRDVETCNFYTIIKFKIYLKYFSLMERDAPDLPGILVLEAWCMTDLVRRSLNLQRDRNTV